MLLPETDLDDAFLIISVGEFTLSNGIADVGISHDPPPCLMNSPCEICLSKLYMLKNGTAYIPGIFALDINAIICLTPPFYHPKNFQTVLIRAYEKQMNLAH